jgi:hypothetical protein
LGLGIEAQPGRQRSTAGQLGAVAQGFALRVGKGTSRQCNAESMARGHQLGSGSLAQRRCVGGIADGEGFRRGQACGVCHLHHHLVLLLPYGVVPDKVLVLVL